MKSSPQLRKFFTRSASLFLVVFLLLQSTSLLAAPLSQNVVDTSQWRIEKNILDTTGQLGNGEAEAFNAAASETGYPVYLFVVSEDLLAAFPGQNTKNLIDSVMAGSFGEDFQWRGNGRTKGLFPDDVIIISIAPFVKKPSGLTSAEIPDSHPWKRAVTDITQTNRFEKPAEMDPVVQAVDQHLIEMGLNPKSADWIVREVVNAYVQLGVFPDGYTPPTVQAQPTVLPAVAQVVATQVSEATASVPPVERRPFRFPWTMVIVIVLLASGAYVFFLLWPAWRRANAARTEVADYAADWEQTRVLEAMIDVVNAQEYGSEATMKALNAKIERAKQAGQSVQADYNNVMRPLKVWWLPLLLHWGFNHIADEIETKLLGDFRAAKKLLDEATTTARSLKVEAENAAQLLETLAAVIASANTVIAQNKADGFPSQLIDAAAEGVADLQANAVARNAHHEYKEASELAEEALKQARIVESDAKGWKERIQGLPLEINGLWKLVDAAQKVDLAAKVAELQAKYSENCWVKVKNHPEAVRKILGELKDALAQAVSDANGNRFDIAATAIANVQAGLAKAQSLAKSVTELAEDLSELHAELLVSIPATLADLVADIEYMLQHKSSIGKATEEELTRGHSLILDAKDEFEGDLPDLLLTEKWQLEAAQQHEKYGKAVKDEVAKLEKARTNAESNLNAAKRLVSKLLNLIEDHEKEIGSAAEELAEEAHKEYEEALADWNEAEGLEDGQEEKRLKLYKAVASMAAQAREDAEEGINEAEDDMEPDAPISTGYGSYSGGSYSTNTPSSSIPTWTPPRTVIVNMPASRPSYSAPRPTTTYSAPRTYSAPAPRSTVSHSTARR